MTSKLIETRAPTPAERANGAEVVFLREDNGRQIVIYACRCYESWEQWGASERDLRDNVPTVEQWRRGFRR